MNLTVLKYAAQLDALPLGAVVLDGDRDAWQRYDEGWISVLDLTCQSDELAEKFYPIHLLWDGTPPNEGNNMTDPPIYPPGSPTGAQRMAAMMDFLNEPEAPSIAVAKQDTQPPDLAESGPACRSYSADREHFCGRPPWHTDDHWCPTCKASWSR